MNALSMICRRLRLFACATVAVVCLTSAFRTASAEPPCVAESKAKTAEAQQHFQKGRKFLDAGVYADAISEFESAMYVKPAPELLFNIAQAYRLAGDAKHSLEMYRRFVEVAPTGQIADEARGHIPELEKQIADAEQAAAADRAARIRYDTMRDEQAHNRLVGEIALSSGGAFAVIGFALAGVGAAENTNSNKIGVAGGIGTAMLAVGILGLIPYGTLKILYNLDPGPYKSTPAAATSALAPKGLVLSFRF